jgi:hypothetical protein
LSNEQLEKHMTDRNPECVAEAVAEATPTLTAKGVRIALIEGFPPKVTLSYNGQRDEVFGIGDGKQSWINEIYRRAAKMTGDDVGPLTTPVEPPAPPAEPVVEVPAAPVIVDDTPVE